MNTLDRDSIGVIWRYLDWETQLLFRQVEPRVGHETVEVDTDRNCRGEIAKWCHSRSSALSQVVEDLHRYCGHFEVREAARKYSNSLDMNYQTMREGRYRGQPVVTITDNAYMQAFLENRPFDPMYSTIHEVLCDRIMHPPSIIAFGKYKGQQFPQVPSSYLEWVVKSKCNVVDIAASRNELRNRIPTRKRPYSDLF